MYELVGVTDQERGPPGRARTAVRSLPIHSAGSSDSASESSCAVTLPTADASDHAAGPDALRAAEALMATADPENMIARVDMNYRRRRMDTRNAGVPASMGPTRPTRSPT